VIIRRYVDFASNDGFDPVRFCLVEEICGSKQIAMIGDGNGRHTPARGFGGKLADFAGAIQKRIVRVQMKVNEVRRSHAKPILNQDAAWQTEK
jgi:hypothetical protein